MESDLKETRTVTFRNFNEYNGTLELRTYEYSEPKRKFKNGSIHDYYNKTRFVKSEIVTPKIEVIKVVSDNENVKIEKVKVTHKEWSKVKKLVTYK